MSNMSKLCIVQIKTAEKQCWFCRKTGTHKMKLRVSDNAEQDIVICDKCLEEVIKKDKEGRVCN